MRRAAFQEVIHREGSPMGAEELLSRVVIVGPSEFSRPFPSTLDGVGLLLIDIFRASETSVVEVLLQGGLARGGAGASFDRVSRCSSTLREGLEGEVGSAAVALKKPFHNPHRPLYNVPRTGTTDESAEASAEGS